MSGSGRSAKAPLNFLSPLPTNPFTRFRGYPSETVLIPSGVPFPTGHGSVYGPVPRGTVDGTGHLCRVLTRE